MLLNRFFWLSFFLLTSTLTGMAQVQYVTMQPQVDEVHDRDVRIRKVELTPEYTVLHMTFQNKRSSSQPKTTVLGTVSVRSAQHDHDQYDSV